MSWFSFRPYVPVAKRRAEAAKLTAKMQKQGRTISPVHIEGRAIATTFWGKAWCDHLESYSDYENRLPRGRTYVRNGSVIDLQITPGKITALVSGSEVYNITIKIDQLNLPRWKAVKAQCAGHVGSVLELLQGRFDKSVMAILTDRDRGLFPAPAEISMKCSCPDWAGMCKHLAAVLYGVGSRLDHQPELLFVLRHVDHLELLDPVTAAGSLTSKTARGQKTLEDNELADVFGIELEATPAAASAADSPAKGGSRRGRATAKKASDSTGSETTSEAPARTGRKPKSTASEPPAAKPKSRKATAKPKAPTRKKPR